MMGNSETTSESRGTLNRISDMLFDVRREEVATVTKFSKDATISNIFNAVLVVVCIWSNDQAQMLLTWLTASVILFLSVYSVGVLARRRELPARIPRGDVLKLVALTFMNALPWPVLGYLTLGHGDLIVSFFILLLCAGMAAGGAMVVYRVPIAAYTYIFTLLLSTTLIISFRSFSELWLMIIFMINFGAMMSLTVTKVWIIARNREEGLKKASNENQELQSANEEIRRLTLLDVLTGLGNRKAFVEQLNERITGEKNSDFSVFMMDLDRFKHINDSIGHDAGDKLLQVVARRLRNAVSAEDVIARFGGDEFALIVTNGGNRDVAVKVADRILARLNEPVMIKNSVVHPNASIGIAFYPEHSGKPDELISLADIALHHAKEKGRGRFEIYNREMAISQAYADEIEKQLRSALDNRTLEVFYQPRIDIGTDEIVGAEALLRCFRETGGLIPTNDILEVAEDRGLIPQISSYVFEKITEDILSWRSRNLGSIPVSINVHAYELKTPELLLAQIKKMFAAGVGQRDILLEVTENCFVGRGADAANATLDIIDDMGIRLSLDDFGTGHAALSHLKRLPVSELKVDREFINGLCSDRSDRAITLATLEIARCLGVRCVAEGVETEQQLEQLKILNTGEISIIGQGYFWARAMNADEFTDHVTSYRQSRQSDQVNREQRA